MVGEQARHDQEGPDVTQTLREKVAAAWCHLFHSGRIDRDHLGRINWRCAMCGRWSDHPVPLDEERAVIDAMIQEAGE